MRLVIGRRVGEKVMIGNEVELTVVGVDRGQISLAFVAPPSVRIDRLEVYLARLEDQRRAKIAGGGA